MFPTDHEFRRYVIAQATAKRIATQIAQQIESGMTEADGYSLAEQSFRQEGIRRHWHMPVIGLGEGTLKLRSLGALAHARITRGRRYAASGDAVMIDIAPVVDGYPSDYTWSGALGTPSETALATEAHKFAQSVVGQLAHTDVGSDIWRLAECLGSTDADSGYLVTLVWCALPLLGTNARAGFSFWPSRCMSTRLLDDRTLPQRRASRCQVRANGVHGRQCAFDGRSRQWRAHLAGDPEGALTHSNKIT